MSNEHVLSQFHKTEPNEQTRRANQTANTIPPRSDHDQKKRDRQLKAEGITCCTCKSKYGAVLALLGNGGLLGLGRFCLLCGLSVRDRGAEKGTRVNGADIPWWWRS